jgi:hypothetical protein
VFISVLFPPVFISPFFTPFPFSTFLFVDAFAFNDIIIN